MSKLDISNKHGPVIPKKAKGLTWKTSININKK